MAESPPREERYGQLLERLIPTASFHWDAVDPEWQALFKAYVRDGMYERTVLDHKTRELCAVAALTVLNQQRALQKHLLAALDYGASRAEVLEVILQMSVYGGFPATQTALDTLRATLAVVDRTDREEP